MRLAVFDIDGTLLRGSSERAFGRYLARRGLLGPRQVAAFLALGLRTLPSAGRHTLKKNKGYLAGLQTAEVDRLAKEFVATELSGRLEPAVTARVQSHLEQGDYVAVLSGTLDSIACALAAELGAQRGIGTLCVTADGVFRPGVPTLHPFGAEKVTQVQKLAAEHGIDAADVVAYADSGHDLDLLRYAGTAVAVRPDAVLRKAALAAGWEILP